MGHVIQINVTVMIVLSAESFVNFVNLWHMKKFLLAIFTSEMSLG